MLARIGAGFQAELDDRVIATVLRQEELPKLRYGNAASTRRGERRSRPAEHDAALQQVPVSLSL